MFWPTLGLPIENVPNGKRPGNRGRATPRVAAERHRSAAEVVRHARVLTNNNQHPQGHITQIV